MRKLIVHGGMHKTGTSSIQSYLRKLDKDHPRQSKFVYSRTGNSSWFPVAFVTRENRRSANPPALVKFDAALAALQKRSKARKFIISAESVASLNSDVFPDFCDFLKSRRLVPEYLFYMRSPVDYMTSSFQQAIKSGRLLKPSQVEMTAYRNISEMIGRGYRVDLVNWERIHDRDVVRDFCERAGVAHVPRKARRENTSLSLGSIKLATLLLRCLRTLEPENWGETRYGARQYLSFLSPGFRGLLARLEQMSGREPFVFSGSLAAPRLAQYREHLEKLDRCTEGGMPVSNGVGKSKIRSDREFATLREHDMAVLKRLEAEFGADASVPAGEDHAEAKAILIGAYRALGA